MRSMSVRQALAVTLAATAILAFTSVASLAATATGMEFNWTPKQTAYLRGTPLRLEASLLVKGAKTPVAGQAVKFYWKCDQRPTPRVLGTVVTNAKGLAYWNWIVAESADRDNNYVWAVFDGNAAAGLDSCSHHPCRVPIGAPR